MAASAFTGCCLALALIAVGCNSQASSTPRVARTPEAKLEAVMQRLNEAIALAAPAEGSGVVSQRKSSYQLIKPEKPADKLRAEVTIQTTRSLAQAAAATTLPKKKPPKEPSPFDQLEAEEETAVDNSASKLGPPLEDPAQEEADESQDNGVTRKAIAESRETVDRKYELVYDGNTWDLAAKPAEDDEVGRALFEYALSGQ